MQNCISEVTTRGPLTPVSESIALLQWQRQQALIKEFGINHSASLLFHDCFLMPFSWLDICVYAALNFITIQLTEEQMEQHKPSDASWIPFAVYTNGFALPAKRSLIPHLASPMLAPVFRVFKQNVINCLKAKQVFLSPDYWSLVNQNRKRLIRALRDVGWEDLCQTHMIGNKVKYESLQCYVRENIKTGTMLDYYYSSILSRSFAPLVLHESPYGRVVELKGLNDALPSSYHLTGSVVAHKVKKLFAHFPEDNDDNYPNCAKRLHPALWSHVKAKADELYCTEVLGLLSELKHDFDSVLHSAPTKNFVKLASILKLLNATGVEFKQPVRALDIGSEPGSFTCYLSSLGWSTHYTARTAVSYPNHWKATQVLVGDLTADSSIDSAYCFELVVSDIYCERKGEKGKGASADRFNQVKASSTLLYDSLELALSRLVLGGTLIFKYHSVLHKKIVQLLSCNFPVFFFCKPAGSSILNNERYLVASFRGQAIQAEQYTLNELQHCFHRHCLSMKESFLQRHIRDVGRVLESSQLVDCSFFANIDPIRNRQEQLAGCSSPFALIDKPVYSGGGVFFSSAVESLLAQLAVSDVDIPMADPEQLEPNEPLLIESAKDIEGKSLQLLINRAPILELLKSYPYRPGYFGTTWHFSTIEPIKTTFGNPLGIALIREVLPRAFSVCITKAMIESLFSTPNMTMKSFFNNIQMAHHFPVSHFKVTTSGPDHAPLFACTLEFEGSSVSKPATLLEALEGCVYWSNYQSTKVAAMNNAIYMMLQDLTGYNLLLSKDLGN